MVDPIKQEQVNREMQVARMFLDESEWQCYGDFEWDKLKDFGFRKIKLGGRG